jgi:hypothetical protein
MGGTVGKGVKSKIFNDFKSDRDLAIGFKDVQFMHKASLGDTGLDLTRLVLPTDSGSFVNPAPSEITSIGSTNLKTKLSIYNGSGSRLALGVSYEIIGTRIVFKGFTALENEIFYGTIRDIKRTGASFLDGKQNIVTGFLVPGEVFFNVGFSFKVNHNSDNRVGAISVKRQRQQSYRNSGNSSTVLDGDFYEVVAGNSQYGTMIKFNNPGVTLPGGLYELIEVKNNDLFVDKENDSLRSELETQQGTVLRVASIVSDIQNIPVSEILSANPNIVQLKQFGDFVISLLQRIEVLESYKEECVLLKDVKADGTPGGTFTSGAWRDRDLNTIEKSDPGVTWVLLDIGLKQFELNPGRYHIRAECPAYFVGYSKVRIANTTDSDYRYGINTYHLANTGAEQFNAIAEGFFEFTENKIFKIQHECSNTKTTDGFGLIAAITSSAPEVYTTVTIKKLK